MTTQPESTDEATNEAGYPLSGIRVVDLSSGIGGAYCSKVLADGGADVIKIESPTGDPLRRRAIGTTEQVPGTDSPLFQYLAASKRSVVADLQQASDRDLLDRLLGRADAIIWAKDNAFRDEPDLHAERLAERFPPAVVVAITPFGLDGPWADRPSTAGTLEAWSGGPGGRGDPERAPVVAGGEQAEWMAGMFAAVGALASLFRARTDGVGDLLDVAELDALVMTQSMYPVTWNSIAGYPWRSERAKNVPDVHAAKDGYVGFMCVTGQHWLDFCVLAQHPEWMDDPELGLSINRHKRRTELNSAINEWCAEHTVQEILELADLLKVPATAVGDGATVPHFDQFQECEFFVKNPGGGFLQPDVPYTLSGGASRRPFGAPPRLGEHTERIRALVESEPAPAGVQAVPPDHRFSFEGVRIADFTAFWAGPIIGSFMGMCGADVIHVESHERPDAMRFSGVRNPGEHWWEWGPLYQGVNTNKRDLTLNFTTERGRELALELVSSCDVVVENYRPAVMEGWGLDYESLRSVRPDLIFVRAPAYGTRGPWRNRGGYAQTMEHVSGMAHLTGFPDDLPQCINGPCDPVAGTHATIALLLAMFHRQRTGDGCLVEVAMVGGALNVAAEIVIEHSANGQLLNRIGNRSRTAAPQGFYLSSDTDADGRQDSWVAISVATDEQWRAFCAVIGSTALSGNEQLNTHAGRQLAHDAIDAIVSAWCAHHDSAYILAALDEAGVPNARVLLPHEAGDLEQLNHRGYFEDVVHPELGAIRATGYPVRFSRGPEVMNRTAAPCLGQHNHEILTELLGLSDAEVEALESEQIIGTAPASVSHIVSVQAP